MATRVDSAAREREGARTEAERPVEVCPRFHAAVEMIGRRWTGAIVYSLLSAPEPLFFRDLAAAIPGVSDRLLSQRLRELESESLVERRVHSGPPARVSYCLSDLGRELEPAIIELYRWAQVWAAGDPPD